MLAAYASAGIRRWSHRTMESLRLQGSCELRVPVVSAIVCGVVGRSRSASPSVEDTLCSRRSRVRVSVRSYRGVGKVRFSCSCAFLRRIDQPGGVGFVHHTSRSSTPYIKKNYKTTRVLRPRTRGL
jgi:hypothetical protein